MTGCPGLFAGGDMIPANKTVTTAVGHGKKAARHVHAYLQRRSLRLRRPSTARRSLTDCTLRSSARRCRAMRSSRTLDEFAAARQFRRDARRLRRARRARTRRSRCLSCGNCNECDTCYRCCPDQAILKLGADLRYLVYVTAIAAGAACARGRCSCGAIEMVGESAASPTFS
jgi:formate dehydrogenase beta subunit